MFTVKVLDHNWLELHEYPEALKKILSGSNKHYDARKKKMVTDTFSFIDFYNFPIARTYTGFLSLIKENFPGVSVADARTFPEMEIRMPRIGAGFDFRAYQVEYLMSALREMRMVVDSSTGSGKTIMMASILDSINLRTLIIVPTLTLLGQLTTELKKILPHRVIGEASSKLLNPNHPVVIGLPGTLSKLSDDWLKTFQVLLMDECHKSPGEICHNLIMTINAPYRYGFSGTPTGRSDGRDLVTQGLFGKVIQLIDREELVTQGYLAKTEVEMYRGSWEGDYHVIEDTLIVNNPKRNALIAKLVEQNRHSTIIILVRRIDHGKILHNMFRDRSCLITGESSAEEREQVRQSAKSGRVPILIATDVFTTGLDISNLGVGINARGDKAEIGTAQGLGRIVRPWRDICKKWIDIYDDYHPMLADHAKERLDIYNQEGYPIKLVNFPPGQEQMLRNRLEAR
jgi:superfamily II DNA or RNA helicase